MEGPLPTRSGHRGMFHFQRIEFVRLLILLITLSFLPLARATAAEASCVGVRQGMSAEQRAQWGQSINRQLGGRLVAIKQAYSQADWVIVFVDAKDADPPFLFFHGSPAQSHYLAMWSGAAMRSEEDSMKAWVLKHAHGIPLQLAACFAWHVTQGQDVGADFGR